MRPHRKGIVTGCIEVLQVQQTAERAGRRERVTLLPGSTLRHGGRDRGERRRSRRNCAGDELSGADAEVEVREAPVGPRSEVQPARGRRGRVARDRKAVRHLDDQFVDVIGERVGGHRGVLDGDGLGRNAPRARRAGRERGRHILTVERIGRLGKRIDGERRTADRNVHPHRRLVLPVR